MISILQTAPAITIDKALAGQRAQAFYHAALASIKVMVLLFAHLLGLTATALQALAKYYKDECHEGLLRWAQSESEPEPESDAETAAVESADITVVTQTGSADTSAAPQLAALSAAIAVSYKGLNSKMLRQLCEEFGVQWRNVHGKGKHLKMQEMKTRIDQAALASSKS